MAVVPAIPPRVSRPLVVVTSIALLTVALVYALHALAAPLRTDYIAGLTGGDVLARGGCLYCAADQGRAQQALLGHPLPSLDAFLEPPVVALYMRPFLLLSPLAGLASFFVLSALALGAAAAAAWRRLGVRRLGAAGALILALTVTGLPAAWIFGLGQTDALLALSAVVSLVLLQGGRPLQAGVALSALTVKPQLVLLLPVVLIVARQWRLLGAFCAGTAALGLADLALAGPAGLTRWVMLLSSHGPDPATSLGVTSVAAWTGSGYAVAITAGVAAAVAAALFWWRREGLRASPTLAVAIGLASSVFVSPHVFAYDLVILAVPFVVAAMRRPAAALVCAALLDAAHLVDTFLIPAGVHLETLCVGGLVVILLGEAAALPERDVRRASAAAVAQPV